MPRATPLRIAEKFWSKKFAATRKPTASDRDSSAIVQWSERRPRGGTRASDVHCVVRLGAGLLEHADRRDERLRVARSSLDDVPEVDRLDHVVRLRVHRQLAAWRLPRADRSHRGAQALLVARVAVDLAHGEIEELRGDVAQLRERRRSRAAERLVLLD